MCNCFPLPHPLWPVATTSIARLGLPLCTPLARCGGHAQYIRALGAWFQVNSNLEIRSTYITNYRYNKVNSLVIDAVLRIYVITNFRMLQSYFRVRCNFGIMTNECTCFLNALNANIRRKTRWTVLLKYHNAVRKEKFERVSDHLDFSFSDLIGAPTTVSPSLGVLCNKTEKLPCYRQARISEPRLRRRHRKV